ncbi:Hypothetical protein NTJ_15835 [Nesidiocoris tenuis]|uniref:SLC26A/SulP transporter domain-containing protein n=1 Tax=Nesidiocoris tenuis TaxID=355587 RepID=A0ABN7BF66_9HEMI|nr:Hypothetical protein NTJ_15835 [Nesidiocoris tenuis]
MVLFDSVVPESSAAGLPGAPGNAQPVTVRRKFPETWLWESISSGLVPLIPCIVQNIIQAWSTSTGIATVNILKLLNSGSGLAQNIDPQSGMIISGKFVI